MTSKLEEWAEDALVERIGALASTATPFLARRKIRDAKIEGALWLLKELEALPILAAGGYEWQNGFSAGVRTILTEARKWCGKEEHE